MPNETKTFNRYTRIKKPEISGRTLLTGAAALQVDYLRSEPMDKRIAMLVRWFPNAQAKTLLDIAEARLEVDPTDVNVWTVADAAYWAHSAKCQLVAQLVAQEDYAEAQELVDDWNAHVDNVHRQIESIQTTIDGDGPQEDAPLGYHRPSAAKYWRN